MKNRLIDLNNHLFEQLERLNDEELSEVELEDEIRRADAVKGIATQIISNMRLALDIQKHKDEMGGSGGVALLELQTDE